MGGGTYFFRIGREIKKEFHEIKWEVININDTSILRMNVRFLFYVFIIVHIEGCK